MGTYGVAFGTVGGAGGAAAPMPGTRNALYGLQIAPLVAAAVNSALIYHLR